MSKSYSRLYTADAKGSKRGKKKLVILVQCSPFNRGIYLMCVPGAILALGQHEQLEDKCRVSKVTNRCQIPQMLF